MSEKDLAALREEVETERARADNAEARLKRAEQRIVQLEQTMEKIPGHRADLTAALREYSKEANRRITGGISGKEGVDFVRGERRPDGSYPRLANVDHATVRNMEVQLKSLQEENQKLRDQLKG